jgi:methylthioribose-1-phosphate isomerase
MVLQAIQYTRGLLKTLDQLLLPHIERYDVVSNSNGAWHAIKEMRVRGAPAIAIVAALGLAVEISALETDKKLSGVAEEVKTFIFEKLDYLLTSRPTAVNLADAAGKLKKVVDTAAAKEGTSGQKVATAYIIAAEQMLVDDVQDNENIGRQGAEWIIKHHKNAEKVSVLTHCNTG